MVNRLSKIVTRMGDDGTTVLTEGQRVAKYSLRIEAIGAVDEVNSFIGLFIESLVDESPLRSIYSRLQNDLFDFGELFVIELIHEPVLQGLA